MLRFNIFLSLVLVLILSACSSEPSQTDPRELSWEQVVQQAKGTKVTLMMWMGDPLINEYMNGYVKPQVKEQLGIDLEIVNGQGAQIVSTLISELESNRSESQIDLMWINGETFYQLRQIDGIFGPFTEALPNMEYVDIDNPFIGIDFQQPVNGYEAPWGNVQFTLIYDPDEVSSPPQNFEEFQKWVEQNPGKFTIPTDFSGMTLLKSWMLAMPDDPDIFYGVFNEEVYQEYSTRLWEEINNMRSDFWRGGRTFPNNVAQLHQLFANGEVAFTMSNNDSEVDNKISQGVFPEDSRGYVLDSGTIQNSHYLGIAKLSSNKAGAMAVINFMISPEAQYEKMKPQVWGDGTVLSIEKLSEEWAQTFAEIPGRTQAPDRSEIQEKALMEPDPEYMIRLFEDFREYVVNE